MKRTGWLSYSVLFTSIVLLDRITKSVVLRRITDSYVVNRFLSFELIFNRGVSWGLFHSVNGYLFALVNLMVVMIILLLAWYTYLHWRAGNSVVGELLVLAGAISNVIDRILYHGVIDFIVFSVNRWTWPAFNIADAAIVVGVGIMLLRRYKRP